MLLLLLLRPEQTQTPLSEATGLDISGLPVYWAGLIL